MLDNPPVPPPQRILGMIGKLGGAPVQTRSSIKAKGVKVQKGGCTESICTVHPDANVQ